VFLIMFKTGHALLLPVGRMSSPRNSCALCAMCSRTSAVSCPQSRHGSDRKPALPLSHPRNIHVREQSPTTFGPRQQKRSETIRSCGSTTTALAKGHFKNVNLDCPRPVRVLEMAAASTLEWPGTMHGQRPALNDSHLRIVPAYSADVCFPVQIKTVPAYVHV
jgi:hypothetical protein